MYMASSGTEPHVPNGIPVRSKQKGDTKEAPYRQLPLIWHGAGLLSTSAGMAVSLNQVRRVAHVVEHRVGDIPSANPGHGTGTAFLLGIRTNRATTCCFPLAAVHGKSHANIYWFQHAGNAGSHSP